MLRPNNPQINVDTLNQRLDVIASQRRYVEPLFGRTTAMAGQPQPQTLQSANDSLSAPGLRGRVKNIPLLGALLTRAARRYRSITTQGLSWQQRFRRVPVVGLMAAWVRTLANIHTNKLRVNTELKQLRHFEEAAKNVLEQSHARISHLEALNLQLQQRLDTLDSLSIAARLAQFDSLNLAARLAQFDSLNLAARLAQFDSLDIAARLAQFESLDIAARLAQFDSLNLAARLAQFESLDIAARLAQFDSLDIAARLAQFESLDIAARLAQFDGLDIAVRLAHLDTFSQTSASEALQHNNRIATLTREIKSLKDAGTQLNSAPGHPARPALPLAATPSSHDSFYVEFEDTFRGKRSDITERLGVYLPYLSKFSGVPNAPMVDVGCGRGEWLGLLQQQGFNATGIDLNPDMVSTCTALGLQAQCMDAVAYLRDQPEGSLALVTGFHIIEHLPFDILLDLLDAALRAMRPDGLVIFETPNPENLIVGACNFYYDPTHRHPIVPVVAQFMAQQRGFAKAEILRLHPYPQDNLLAEDSEVAKRLNQAFYGPQDYALVAWKTHAT
jgi:O-antigen chain-terminating methyltransferase